MNVPSVALPCPEVGGQRLPFHTLYQLVETVGRAVGLGRPRQAVLLHLMRQTATSDWSDPRRLPTCFRAQQELADDLGITPRQMRTHEAELAKLGFIEIATGANGRRSGVVLRDGRRLGLNFGPLLARVNELLAIRDASERRRHQMRALRLECSAERRNVRQLLSDPDLILDSEVRATILEECASWPCRYETLRDPASLLELLEAIKAVSTQLSAAIRRSETSAAQGQNLPALLNTEEIEKVSCTRRAAENGPEIAGGATKENGLNLQGRAHTTGQPRAEKDPPIVKCPLPYRALSHQIPPSTLRDLATDDFKLILEYCAGPGQLSAASARRAGIELALHLGIAPYVYDQAAEILGDNLTILAVFYIERNVKRPGNPIRSPSAMLRSLSNRALAGSFNAVGMIQALSRKSPGSA